MHKLIRHINASCLSNQENLNVQRTTASLDEPILIKSYT